MVGEKSHVRGDQHVGESQQPRQFVVGRHLVGQVAVEIIGFLLIHVDSQIADLAGFQKLNHLIGFQQSAATGVDDEHTILEIGQGFLVEDMVGLRGQRAVQGDDVGLAGKGGTVHVSGVFFHLLVGVFVVSQDTAAETAEIPNHHLPDLAGAEHPNSLVAQFEPSSPAISKLNSRLRL
jgi:hypothetical protein